MHAHKKPQSLAEVMIAGLPGAVERQEAAGQAELCRTEVLPKECPRAELEKFGVVFSDDHDDLFVNVTLPAGWKKQPTDHSMWSDLIDDKGRKRAAIFYKAAFYDRSAHMNLERRYRVDAYWPCDAAGQDMKYGEHTHFRTVARDGGTVLQSFGEIRPDAAYSPEAYDLTKKQEADARAWLDERFPEWNDATAYWD